MSTTKMRTMRDLLVHELQDLYDAEQRLASALPKMAESAHSDTLQGIFESHLQETKTHVDRLRKSLEILGESTEGEPCHAMKGIIAEGKEAIEMKADEAVRDAALLAAGQRVEHYAMAGYGTAHSFATQAGEGDVAGLMRMSLDDAKNGDRKLTALAKERINARVET